MQGLLSVTLAWKCGRIIWDGIRSCSEYDVSLCGFYDFKFIDMNGKHASVKKTEIHWSRIWLVAAVFMFE